MIMTNLIILTIFMIFFSSTFAQTKSKSKYSRVINEKSMLKKSEIAEKMKIDNPFRMQKFNLFWQKVKTAHHLDDDHMTQLFAELATHDEREIELKHAKGNSEDADGEMEAQLRRSFIDIMKRFQLRKLLTPELKTQFAKSEEKNNFDDRLEEKKQKMVKSKVYEFGDEKIKHLMEDAIESREFDEAEMGDLAEEMRHMAERQEERHLISNEDDFEWKEEQRKARKGKKNKKIVADNLHDQLTTDFSKSEGLNHPKVLRLWKAAQRGNFSDEELNELMTELKHFEAKLYKHEAVGEQVAILTNAKTTIGGDDHGHHHLSKEMETKHEQLKRGIKKMETYLEDKISKPRLEL